MSATREQLLSPKANGSRSSYRYAYETGFLAGGNGLSVRQNPYRLSNKVWSSAWLMGFQDGKNFRENTKTEAR